MAQFTLKVDDVDKKEASEIVEDLGLDLPTVTRAFYKQIIRERRVPLNLSLDSEELPKLTTQALGQAERIAIGGEGQSYSSANEMFANILGTHQEAAAPNTIA